MARVLFVCLHNAGRSQMSRALFERAAEGRHEADSAGTTPADRIHPEVVEAMRELGLDLDGARPKKLTDDLARAADVVVTMGCGDECPYIPGKRYLDWDLPDPKGRPLEEVREIRDDIERRVPRAGGGARRDERPGDRGLRPPQVLRRDRGRARRQLRRAPGRGVRPAGAQRRGQDHHGRDPRGLPRAELRARCGCSATTPRCATAGCRSGSGSCCRAAASTRA